MKEGQGTVRRQPEALLLDPTFPDDVGLQHCHHPQYIDGMVRRKPTNFRARWTTPAGCFWIAWLKAVMALPKPAEPAGTF